MSPFGRSIYDEEQAKLNMVKAFNRLPVFDRTAPRAVRPTCLVITGSGPSHFDPVPSKPGQPAQKAEGWGWTLTVYLPHGAQNDVKFSAGSAHVKPPTMAEIMSCLIDDARGVEDQDFESWASDMGWDTDSRKAEKCFNACRDIYFWLRRCMGPADYEAACAAEDLETWCNEKYGTAPTYRDADVRLNAKCGPT